MFYLMRRRMHDFFAKLRERAVPVLRRRLESHASYGFRARIGRNGAARPVTIDSLGIHVDIKKNPITASFKEIDSWVMQPNGTLIIHFTNNRKVELFPFIEQYLDATGFTLLTEKLPTDREKIA